MFKKLLIAASISMALVACSFEKDDSNNDAPRVKENERKKREFDKVLGFYKGTVTTPSMVQTVSFTLYTLSKDAVEPTLNSNFKRLAPIGKDFNFKVDYIQETGQLTFSNADLESNPNAGKVAADDIHTIDARIKGQLVVGEVKSKSGVIGVLNATLTTQPSEKPGDQQEQEYYDRLAAQYKSIAGRYTGQSINDDNKALDIIIDIRVRTINSNGLSVPQLYGTYKRVDDPSEQVALNLTFDYQYDIVPARLVIEGVPKYYSSRDYRAYFSGTLQNEMFIGYWSTTIRGFEGNFQLNRTKFADEEPDLDPDLLPLKEPKAPAPTGDPKTCAQRIDKKRNIKWPCLPEKVAVPGSRPENN